MKTHARLFLIISGTALLLCPLLLFSCAVREEPDAAAVQKVLGSFYDGQGYRVISLELGTIEGEPVAQKTYGRKRAFFVTVRKIVLEGKGRQVTREKGVVKIRQQEGKSGEWAIEGMPAELAP